MKQIPGNVWFVFKTNTEMYKNIYSNWVDILYRGSDPAHLGLDRRGEGQKERRGDMIKGSRDFDPWSSKGQGQAAYFL